MKYFRTQISPHRGAVARPSFELRQLATAVWAKQRWLYTLTYTQVYTFLCALIPKGFNWLGRVGTLYLLVMASMAQPAHSGSGVADTKPIEGQAEASFRAPGVAPDKSPRFDRTDVQIPPGSAENQPWDLRNNPSQDSLGGAKNGGGGSEDSFEYDQTLWKAPTHSSNADSTKGLNVGTSAVQTLAYESLLYIRPGEVWFLAKSPSGERKVVGISVRTYSTLIKSQVLALMGYKMPPIQLAEHLTLTFIDSRAQKKFMSHQSTANLNFAERNWVREANSTAVQIRVAVVEDEAANYLAGVAAGGFFETEQPSQALTDRQQTRLFRGLFLPLQLLDFEESFALWPLESCAQSGKNILARFAYPQNFKFVNQDDLNWSWGLFAKINPETLNQVLANTKLPPELQTYLRAKIISRSKSWAKCLQQIPPTIGTSTPDEKKMLDGISVPGLIDRGIIIGKRWSDLPFYFMGSPDEPPFEVRDVVRLLYNEIKWAFANRGLSDLLKKTVVDGAKEMATAEAESIKEGVLSAMAKGVPYQQPFRVRSATVAGVQAQVNRSFAHGALFGIRSDRILLADTLAVSGSLGKMWTAYGLDHRPTVSLGGSVGIAFAYIRPVSSVEEGVNKPSSDLLIPLSMLGIADDLRADPVKAVVDLARKMHETETFSTTVMAGATAQISSLASWDVLFGGVAPRFQNMAYLGWDENVALIWSRTLRRTAQGFEFVFRRPPCWANETATGLCAEMINASKKSSKFSFGLRYYLDFFQATWSEAVDASRVYVHTIEFDPESISKLRNAIELARSQGAKNDLIKLEADLEAQVARARELGETIYYMLFQGDSEYLSSLKGLQQHSLAQRSDNSEQTARFLWLRGLQLERVFQNIVQPLSSEISSGEFYRLLQVRRGGLFGSDIKAASEDLLNALVRENKFKLQLTSLDARDPSMTPLGSSQWRTITAEGTDLQPRGTEKLPMTLYIQKNWGAFHASKSTVLASLADLNRIYHGFWDGVWGPSETSRNKTLLPESLFHGTESVTLFRLQLRAAIFEPGLLRLEQNLTTERIVPFLATALSPSNPLQGRSLLYEYCQVELRSSNPNASSGTGQGYHHGQWFECLSPWMVRMMDIVALPSKTPLERLQKLARAVDHLETRLPLISLLNRLGHENYSLCALHLGFRHGLEEASQPLRGDCLGGAPAAIRRDFEQGLMEYLANRTKISVTEMNPVMSGDIR